MARNIVPLHLFNRPACLRFRWGKYVQIFEDTNLTEAIAKHFRVGAPLAFKACGEMNRRQ
ncbi:MAG TPA: hypothetical protein VLA50_03670 [Erythrobacter sp.]|nr:hypothetical protein [Erythrobacter sp.]